MVLPCNIPPFDFNPRSREGSDRNSAHGCDSGNNFNPRSREGSDMAGTGTGVVAPVFQSALPRRERPLYFIACKIHSTISIRAPAKGATLCITKMYLENTFQSALPRRERHGRAGNRCSSTGISIRAPAKGATALFYRL